MNRSHKFKRTKVTFSSSLDLDVYEWVADKAYEENVSMSSILNDILKTYIVTENSKEN